MLQFTASTIICVHVLPDNVLQCHRVCCLHQSVQYTFKQLEIQLQYCPIADHMNDPQNLLNTFCPSFHQHHQQEVTPLPRVFQHITFVNTQSLYSYHCLTLLKCNNQHFRITHYLAGTAHSQRTVQITIPTLKTTNLLVYITQLLITSISLVIHVSTYLPSN